VRSVADLNEAAGLLKTGDDIVLALPVSAILAQRLRLPTVDPSEFSEMVRLQVEKSFPYPPEEVTSDFEVIEQAENDSVVSSIAVHNARLTELAAPLVNRGHIPRQVTVYAAQRAASRAARGRALIIYREGEKLVSAISENGKISLTRTLNGAEAEELEQDLPQLALSAELQGIDTSFPTVLLDESCLPLRDTIERVFAQRPSLMGMETPPATVKLDLTPAAWRQQRAALVRQKEWRKRLLWAGGAYAAAFLLFALYVAIIRFQVGHLKKAIQRDAPKVDFVKQTEAGWKALAPAIDPHFYPIEVLLHLFESLPNKEVRITVYDQTARNISVQGEAPSAALAYQFAEKVKKHPDLQGFIFNLGTPRILPNDHAQFRLEGKTK
jgi:ArsR family metal-binding transcriptional regulator